MCNYFMNSNSMEKARRKLIIHKFTIADTPPSSLSFSFSLSIHEILTHIGF